MIGFQQQQSQQATTVASHGKSPESRASPPRDQHQLPQLSQHCQNMSLAGTPPVRPISSASSSASSPSPTHSASNQQQIRTRQPHKTSNRRVSSPGYHSAASSPGSSSIASPVSSSSSSGVSSAASSSSHRPTPNISSAHQTLVTCTTASLNTHEVNCHSHHAINSPQQILKQQEHQVAKQTSNGNQTQLLDHFPEIGHNGLRLSWFHNANNRQTLDNALASAKLIVSGDISLAEMSRYPVPIMARPPLGVSDLTLETWLSDVIQSRKGIKLTFTSTRTVEPAFRVLARHAQNLKGPLILSADILTRPSGTSPCANQAKQSQQQSQKQCEQQQPVDAWTFLMLCRTRFPRSIISIGWCPAAGQTHGPDLSVQPADSSTTSGLDSMFELDMMAIDQHQHPMPPAVSQPHHFSQPILHLSSTPTSHQQRLSSLNVVQQLAAVAAAAAANNGEHQKHFVLSSYGSLNSSSGNSSGSPSPTSPISHLIRHHNSQQAGWPAMAAAAMVAANNLRQRCHLDEGDEEAEEDEDEEDEDQLPLNLNINEADPQHATPQGALNDLAQKIHSLQQQSSNLNTLTSSLSKVRSHPMASHNNGRWEHISKKAALAHRLNADSPSPVSTSPKQQQAQHLYSNHLHQHQTSGSNLLCVKAPHQQQQQHHNHHHSLANLALATQGPLRHALSQNPAAKQQQVVAATTRDSGQLGYTREMIDKMASLVKEYNLTQAITFPVEARQMLRNNSLAELQRLLYQVGAHSTLTIVAQQEDLISVEDLLLIRKHFAAQQLLFDLPDELAASLRRELDR